MSSLLGCPWKLVRIVSKLVYNPFRGLVTYLYIGVISNTPFTKYHGANIAPENGWLEDENSFWDAPFQVLKCLFWAVYSAISDHERLS